MSLQFVIGSPKSGKSTLIYNKIINEAVNHPNKNYIIMVPEQFTMLTQKELVSLHPDNVIMNIDVLSFNRLAYRVFDELGVDVLDVLEESGKSLLIKKLLMKHKDELESLSAVVNKNGYVNELKSFISELSQYNIDSSQFDKICKSGGFSSNFLKKAKDITVIYKAYEDFIKDRYITSENILVKLNDVISKSRLIDDTVFVFDSFTGFTPLQNELLMTILPSISKAYVVVTLDSNETLYGAYKEYELFYMSKKMISKTSYICKKCGVDIEDEPIVLKSNYCFHKDGHIKYIEKNLFRTGKREPYNSDCAYPDLSIHLLANPRAEIEFIASQISKDVREGNIRYKDIAICAANLVGYKDYFDSIFSDYNIPYYVDSSNEVVYSVIIEFIRSAFLVVKTNFSYETLMQFLRCNLSGLTIGEVDVFDIYLSAAKIRGFNAYNNEFTYVPKGFDDRLGSINDIRRRGISPLLTFYESLSEECTAKDTSIALYNLLTDYNIEDKINSRKDALEKNGEHTKASLYIGIYKELISILDKIVVLIGDEVIEADDYAKMLLFACENAKVMTIPAKQDCVVIGDLERTRYDKPKAMYLCGVNDGAIPKVAHSSGIISQTERSALKKVFEDSDMELAPSDREKSFMQRFYVYMVLTKASSKLCITYAAADNDANSLSKSYLIDEIMDMFDDIDIDICHFLRPDDYIVSCESTKGYVAKSLRQFVNDKSLSGINYNDINSINDMNDLTAMVSLISLLDDKYNNIINGAFYYHKSEEIERLLFDRLIDADNPMGSVSRLEAYNRCAYSFFINYCLKIRERQIGALKKLDLGSIYHDILEDFSIRLRVSNIKWKDVDNKLRDKLLDESVQKVYNEYNKIELISTPMEQYTLDKIKMTMDKTIASLIKQAQHTDFEPYRFEVDLDEIASKDTLEMILNDGRTMKLSGRIDRIDTYKNDNIIYVKIIDYKSGNSKIDYEKIYNGLQLQLIYYLDAAVKGLSDKSNSEYKPAAIFYYHVKDPIVDYNYDDDIDNLIIQDMMPSGIFFDDVDENKMKSSKNDKSYDSPGILKTDISHALDNSGDIKSMYAPIKYTSKGALDSRTSHALSTLDINRLERYIEKKMVEIGSNMYDAIIDAKPFKENSCEYCPYGGICGFDKKLPGCEYSKYHKLGNDKLNTLFELIGD